MGYHMRAGLWNGDRELEHKLIIKVNKNDTKFLELSALFCFLIHSPCVCTCGGQQSLSHLFFFLEALLEIGSLYVVFSVLELDM